MKKLPKVATYCLIANAIGLGCYLFFCSRLWAGMPGSAMGADDGPSVISWFFTAFPFMVGCTVFDIVVLVLAIRHVFVGKGWSLAATWLAVIGVWVILQLYVRSHIVG